MENGKTKAFCQRCLSPLARISLVFMGLTIFGQGCTDLDQFVKNSRRQHRLTQQMERAEDELRKGNLLSARTLLEWVYRESKSSRVQERALFFSGFTILLDKRDENRLERGQKVFVRVSETFPGGGFGQISVYVAEALSDALVAMEVLEKDNGLMTEEIDRERSHSREMDRLVQNQKKRLSEKSDKIAALKNSLSLKDKEIESLKLKIKKLEEIHKKIKKKRKSLS